MAIPVFMNPRNGMKLKVSVEENKEHIYLYRCFLPGDANHSDYSKGVGENRVGTQGRQAGELSPPIEPALQGLI